MINAPITLKEFVGINEPILIEIFNKSGKIGDLDFDLEHESEKYFKDESYDETYTDLIRKIGPEWALLHGFEIVIEEREDDFIASYKDKDFGVFCGKTEKEALNNAYLWIFNNKDSDWFDYAG